MHFWNAGRLYLQLELVTTKSSEPTVAQDCGLDGRHCSTECCPETARLEHLTLPLGLESDLPWLTLMKEVSSNPGRKQKRSPSAPSKKDAPWQNETSYSKRKHFFFFLKDQAGRKVQQGRAAQMYSQCMRMSHARGLRGRGQEFQTALPSREL